MAFDKAAYWAQRGEKRAKGRSCVILQCPTCRSSSGTVNGPNFICNTEACQRKLAKTLLDHLMAAEAAEAGKLPQHLRPAGNAAAA